MANEFTLADYEATAAPLTKAVVRTWREASPIMDMLSFKSSNQLEQGGIRWNKLPTVPWRKIGESFTQLKTEPDPWRERVYFMGAKIDIPREYVKAESLTDNRAAQTEAILRGSAFGFNEAFFVNDPTVDEDAITGIHYRVLQKATTQYFAASIDISPDTALANWQHVFFDAVDDLLSRVDGNPSEKVLFMGRTMYRRFNSALRSSNLLSTTVDQIGRQFLQYGANGPKLVEAGYKVDQTTQILTDANSATALTGGAHSSLYCVRFGEPYLAGWAQEMPNAEDKGETEDGVNMRTIVRFSPGLYDSSPRSIAMAHSITAA
jgi:hypothetical protein